jgi:hypothetical protein
MNIKYLRFDGRGEYFLNEFSESLKKHEIWRKYSCRFSPYQNGVVKRKNMHIVNITHVMLNEKNLPHYFWAEVVISVVYIMNQTPITTFHGMTPKEKSQAIN